MPDAPTRFGHRDPAHRVERRCDSCQQWDFAPRHHHVNADGSDSIKHLDCCEADGCPTDTGHVGNCGVLLEKVGRKKNDDLVKALRALPADHSAPDKAETARQAAARRQEG